MSVPTIDRAALAALHAVESGFVADLADSFLTTAPVLLAELRAATVLDKRSHIRRIARDLSESGAVFGAAHLADLCKAAESAPSLPRWLTQVGAEYARVSAALKTVASTGVRRMRPRLLVSCGVRSTP
jgi:HPt (histidine-containing phosphotransfer) domain-containing protein